MKKRILVTVFLLSISCIGQSKIAVKDSKITKKNDFVGNWMLESDGALANFEIKNNNTIEFSGGPCQGSLKYTLNGDKLELIYTYSECNYRGFNNKKLLGSKIGECYLKDKKLILDLKKGDDLLNIGKTVLIRSEF